MKTISKIFLATLFFLPHFSSAQLIVGGGQHTMVVCGDGTLQAWGLNLYGEVGNGTFNSNIAMPVPVNSLTGVTAISAGFDHSLALKNGTVWCWGWNYSGQLGDGSYTISNIPVQVTGLPGIIAISGGVDHSLAIDNSGNVWAWGNNALGQLGNGGITTSNNTPVQVTGLTNVIAIAGGCNHSLAVRNDSTVWAWGWNMHGELGNGSNVDSNVPVQVPGLTGIMAVAGYDFFSLALKSDGTVWAWGHNFFGELGNGNNTDSNVPVQVSSLTGIIAIASGAGAGNHAVALKNDGTVWCWGYNSTGELGNGTNVSSNVPVQVSGLTGVVAVSSGAAHSIALKNDGTIWVWGSNSFSQLGDNTAHDTNTPIEVHAVCKVPAAVNEIATSANISVFPNPSNGIFTLNSKITNGEIFIYNTLGEIIYESKIISPDTKIDLMDEPNGIYFVNVKTDAESFTQKIIIEK